MRDEEILDEFLKILADSLQLITLPKVINYHVTKWGANPFTLGSYSYFGPKCDKELQE